MRPFSRCVVTLLNMADMELPVLHRRESQTHATSYATHHVHLCCVALGSARDGTSVVARTVGVMQCVSICVAQFVIIILLLP